MKGNPMPSSDKFETIRTAIETLLKKHNKKKGVKQVDVDAILGKLAEEVGTSLASLRKLTRDDYIAFGCPRATADDIVALAAAPVPKSKASKTKDDGSEPTEESQKAAAAAAAGTGPSRILMMTAADQALEMPINELVAAYDPNAPDNYIGAALKARSSGKPFLIWSKAGGTQLDRVESAAYLQDIVDDVPVLDYVTVDGEAYEPLPIGVRPNAIFDENPIYAGEILRKGNVCGTTNANWAGVGTTERQFIRVLVNRHDLTVSTPKDVHELVRQLKTETGFEELKGMYPAAAAAFRQMLDEERPTLKVRRARGANAARPGSSHPFSQR